MLSTEFSSSSYRELVTAFLEHGYVFTDFTDSSLTGPKLLMRHDVDLCPRRALRVAEIEADLGVRSTFFYLAASDFYNLFSRQTRSRIRAVAALGHCIGLHFDNTVYDSESDLDRSARIECDALAEVAGSPVEIVSFHRPAPMLQGRREFIGGRAHTYEPRFFSAIDYCTDSAGTWAHGHPLDRKAFELQQPMQVVTHPIWWTSESHSDPREVVHEFYAELQGQVRAELKRNLSKGSFSGAWI